MVRLRSRHGGVPHRPSTRVLFGALVSSGLVAAHSLVSLMAAPGTERRHELLTPGGHEPWWFLFALAVGLGIVLIGPALNGHATAGRSATSITLHLAATQIVAFLLVEFVERAIVGGQSPPLWREPGVLLGIPLQLVTACLGALLLSVSRAVVASLRWFRPGLERLRRPVTRSVPVLAVGWAPAALPGTGGSTLRGPPEPH